MFNTVRKWVDEQPDRQNLNSILSSASVKAGHNHKNLDEKNLGSRGVHDHHDHGALGGHGKTSGSIWTEIRSRDLGAMEGKDGNPAAAYMVRHHLFFYFSALGCIPRACLALAFSTCLWSLTLVKNTH
jgi:hypothetical protein